MSDELKQLAFEIADSTAISDIEAACPTVGGDEKVGWLYDVSNPDEIDAYFIEQGLRYLDMRGILIRKPDAPHIVTFKRDAN